MGAIASQITSLTIVYSTVYSDADQRKHQSSASLAFVWGIHRGPVNSPHKWPVTRKMFPFDDVIMVWITAEGNKENIIVFISVSIRNVVTSSALLNKLYSTYIFPYPGLVVERMIKILMSAHKESNLTIILFYQTSTVGIRQNIWKTYQPYKNCNVRPYTKYPPSLAVYHKMRKYQALIL